MNEGAAAKIAEFVSLPVPSLGEEIAAVESKIREDLLRFRTCCADPRASK